MMRVSLEIAENLLWSHVILSQSPLHLMNDFRFSTLDGVLKWFTYILIHRPHHNSLICEIHHLNLTGLLLARGVNQVDIIPDTQTGLIGGWQ